MSSPRLQHHRTQELFKILGALEPSWRSGTRRPANARRRALLRTWSMGIVTLLAVVWPWFAFGKGTIDHCDGTTALAPPTNSGAGQSLSWTKWVVFWDALASGLMFGLVAMSQMRWWRTSRYLVAVRWHLVLMWLVSLLYLGTAQWTWCFPPTTVKQEYAIHSATHFRLMIALSAAVWSMDLIRRHLAKLEKAFERPLGSKWLRISIGFNAFLVFASVVGGTTIIGFIGSRQGHTINDDEVPFEAIIVILVLLALFALASLSVYVFTVRGFALSLWYAWTEASMCDERQKAVAHRLVRVARRVVMEISLNIAAALPTTVTFILMFCFHESFNVHFASVHVTNMLQIIIASRCVCLLSGLLPTAMDLGDAPEAFAENRPQLLLHPSFKSVVSSEPPDALDWSTGDAEWDSKVWELSKRGLSLRALLSFYKRLGTPEVMPHFDPERHTTSDVVRCAIIPMSKEGKNGPCGLSTILMGDRPTVPRKMVTHSWSNLFSHLVGAIAADALGQVEYESVIGRLTDSELYTLECELYWKGKLDETYWVCCFSVNQHASICDAVAPCEIDSVTGKLHASCDCHTGKCQSTTPPLRADGESIPCEMNKFDDMMGCLSTKRRDFAHLVAVDQDFRLFTRAWCVAELYQAHMLSLPQSLCLHSGSGLKFHTTNLRCLRVEDMEASRRSDKDMILAKIEDMDAFNRNLQRLIFEEGGLLQAWMQNMDVASVLGTLARQGYQRAASLETSGPTFAACLCCSDVTESSSDEEEETSEEFETSEGFASVETSTDSELYP